MTNKYTVKANGQMAKDSDLSKQDNSFWFSDDISDWIHSNAYKKGKYVKKKDRK